MSKLTVEECKRIIMQGRKQLTAAEQRIAELEANNGTRWHELFGTPERAARTLVDSCNDDYDYGCGGCPVAHMNCMCGDYVAILEWLKQ